MYCLSVYLIQIQSYHHFSNMAVDHWCLSLSQLGGIGLYDIWDYLSKMEERSLGYNILEFGYPGTLA